MLNAKFYSNKGYKLHNQGMSLEANHCYNLAIQANPKIVNARTNQGLLLIEMNQFDEALQILDTAIDIDPLNAKAYTNKGVGLQNLGRMKEASICYKQAIQIDHQTVMARINLSQLLCSEKLYDEATQMLDQVIKLDPTNAEAFTNKAVVLSLQDRNEEEMLYYDKAIEANPKLITARMNKALLLIQKNQLDQSLAELDKIIQIDPKNAEVHYNKGYVLLRQNAFKASLSCFNLTTQLDQQHILGFAFKAHVEQILWMDKKAVLSLEKVDFLFKNPISKQNLSQVQFEFIRNCLEKLVIIRCKQNKYSRQFSSPQEVEIQNISQELQQLKLLMTSNQIKQQGDYADLKRENIQIKKDNIASQNQSYNQTQFHQELKKDCQKAGIYETIQIKDGWNKYKKISPEIYDYTKAFYWTMLYYLDAYAVASTGAVLIDEDHTDENQQGTTAKLGSQILEYGVKIASSLPLIGIIVKPIKTAIGAIYGQIKIQKYQNRTNAIINIIMLNEDPDAQVGEDISKTIALAAQEIADRKYAIEIGKIQQAEDSSSENGHFQKEIEFIKQQINPIIDYAKSHLVELYSSQAGQDALSDVILLMVYMTLKYDEIIKATRTQKLYMIIADQVLQKSLISIISEGIKEGNEKTN